MRAIVYDAVGAEPRLTDVVPPLCPVDGAVVDVAATGVCRSDWHAWRGHEEVTFPHVPGHEFAGTIAALGAQVSGFTVGDRVTAPFVNGCGLCTWCATGQAQLCPDQTQPGFSHPGSFAEQVVVRAAGTNLVRLPDAIDFPAAAALGCRFATAFRALTGHGPLVAGDWVAVFGCGGVGLSAVMIARALGARVIAVDPSAPARDRAAEFGAEVTMEPTGAIGAIQQLSAGGVHLSIDAFGSAPTAADAVRSLRRGGRHVQAGLMLAEDALAPLPWDLLISRELQIHGSHGMAAADYPAMLDLVTAGRLHPERLIGSLIGLEQAGRALMALDDPVPANAGTVVITL